MWIGAGPQPAWSSTRAFTKFHGPTLIPSASSHASTLHSTLCLPRHLSGLELRTPASRRHTGTMASWRWRLALGAAASRPPREALAWRGSGGRPSALNHRRDRRRSTHRRESLGAAGHWRAGEAAGSTRAASRGRIDSWRRLPRTCLRRSSAAGSDVEPDFDFELKMDDGHHVFDGMLARREIAAQRGRRGSMPRIRYSGDVGSTRPLGCDTPGKRWPMQVHQSSKVCCSSSGLKLISHQIS